jgi:hypothetical protein
MSRFFDSQWFPLSAGLVFYGVFAYGMHRAVTYGDELAPMIWIGALVLVLGLVTIGALRVRRRSLEVARQPRAELEELEAWAADNGWTVQHLGHPTLTDEIERIEMLTDNAGWGHGTTGGQRHSGSDDWAFGGGISRDTASGRLIVIAGFRYDRRRLWAALKTGATAPRVTWDLVEDDRVEQSGPTPELSDGEPLQNLFVGLEPTTRLRIINGEILLCTPGRLEAERLEQIAGRLTSLERRLPRPPGAGPQR